MTLDRPSEISRDLTLRWISFATTHELHGYVPYTHWISYNHHHHLWGVVLVLHMIQGKMLWYWNDRYRIIELDDWWCLFNMYSKPSQWVLRKVHFYKVVGLLILLVENPKKMFWITLPHCEMGEETCRCAFASIPRRQNKQILLLIFQ